ncbi:hypothetical protein [Nocardia terpenica]|uniref:DUF8175 domain-containing protein n=1 Tax=Nocardia terpenica TaxID=455432 RepID=A0A291RZ38_9NOCA|nr:hypothetical protein [Nocardia terpenica]ATL72544.1 hypothetical protein CRH09_39945 [Nocardia terpenica]
MRRPSTRRALGTLAATAAAALLAVTGCGDGGHESTTGPAAPDLNRAPAGVHWQTWQGVALPVSSTDGPADIDAAATGYSHTPQGAALAAIQHSIRTMLAPDDSWPTIAARSLVPLSPGADAWKLTRVLVSKIKTDPAAVPRIAGYKITSWSPGRAAVTVYTTYSDASVLASDTTVTWTAGDWRLLLPDPAAKIVTQHDVPAVPADAVRLEAQR